MTSATQVPYHAVLGAVISNQRTALSLRQQDAAAEVGVSPATWSRIERGTTAISPATLARWAARVGLSMPRMMEQVDAAISRLEGTGTIEVLFTDAPSGEQVVDPVVLGLSALIGALAAISPTIRD